MSCHKPAAHHDEQMPDDGSEVKREHSAFDRRGRHRLPRAPVEPSSPGAKLLLLPLLLDPELVLHCLEQLRGDGRAALAGAAVAERRLLSHCFNRAAFAEWGPAGPQWRAAWAEW
eukprot:CAMPEP_0196687780 /NCGR_PEP_ID=MMETSP1090-20130531/15514_1 /TAXON_ID=37098 /ORGANISM="Isochrysis sp, Strain CCMP1244" /LENGTH=114 /DNA_ID=CAMNT_0042026623 /DNA_START=239 /DNA_END=580 /DNA_ORIENTATION=-